MRTIFFGIGLLFGLLAGCSADWAPSSASLAQSDPRVPAHAGRLYAPRAQEGSLIAGIPDRGSLLVYEPQRPVRKGADTWHAVQMSEEHALRAIGSGSLVLNAPDGQTIRLKYERHVEHPDGNWTFVGRPIGDAQRGEAILTFGEKAVFGSIPQEGDEPLQLTMAGGRTWLVETDATLRARQHDADVAPDFLPEPKFSPGAERKSLGASGQRQMLVASGLTTEAVTVATTVDLVIGYTSGFAARLGGQSQARTRLNFLVEIANQAYINSQVDGQLRLVHAMQVNYPDATTNRSALFELSGVSCVPASGGQLPDGGVSCTQVGQPAALQPLIAAREQYGADLVSLVRKFEFPENQSCGIAWMLGGGQSAIDSSSAAFGMSIVSDSGGNQFPDETNTCREDYLAHEVGHNMGQQHDRLTAQGTDDTNGDDNLLDPEEFGRHPYSFGYSTGLEAGNFYTVMAIRRDTQVGYRVFSNPRIASCGGFNCGVAEQADNARSLGLTIPVIANFRTALVPIAGVWLRGDFNGDGRADILWRNRGTGANVVWRSANAGTQQILTTVANQAWVVVGVGDFNGDNRSDILWRNLITGGNVIWRSANSATQQILTTVANQAWGVAGIGDFDGDNRSDILWRNSTTGANVIWRSANSATQQILTTVANQAWVVVGVGDFNADNRSDILWRNFSTGANVIWRSASAANQQLLATVGDLNWVVAGVGDFNADGRWDIVWRNRITGANVMWRSANAGTQHALVSVTDQAWIIVGVGDFDGDNRADILWRNFSTGANVLWRSASAASQQLLAPVTNFNWIVAG